MLDVVLAVALQRAVLASDSLTLDEALRRARVTRPDVTAAGARITEANARRSLVSRPSNPSLEYSSVAIDETRRISMSQSLATFVRLPSERGAASAGLEAARADSLQRLANLERDVTRAFYGALAAEARVRLMRDLAQLADSLGALAGRRAQVGDISELDREQFALEGTRARLQLSRALEERAARSAAFARQLGWETGPPPGPAGRLDQHVSEPDTAAAPAVEAIPEVQRARAEARAAAHAERSASWARLPVPGLLFERDWSQLAGVRTSTRLGVSLPVPLFSRGNETFGVAASRARAADAQADEVALEVSRALSTARARVAESSRRARLASDTLLVGVVRLRQGAVRLYDAGRTSVLQVLEALRAERDAQLTAIDELLAFQEARADLAALAGRSTVPSTR